MLFRSIADFCIAIESIDKKIAPFRGLSVLSSFVPKTSFGVVSEIQYGHITQFAEPTRQWLANTAEELTCGEILAIENLSDPMIVSRFIDTLLCAEVSVDRKCSGVHDFLSFKKLITRFDSTAEPTD